jgi:hypothetical protein
MRIPILAVTLVASVAVVTLPAAANAAPPVAVNDSAQTEVETSKDFDVLTNDAANAGNAGKTLSVIDATDTPHATVSCTTAGLCTYTPDVGWTGGNEAFTYTVSDGVDTAQGTVTVTTFNVGTVSPTRLTPTKPGYPFKWPNTVDVSATVTDPGGAALSGVEMTLFAKYPPPGNFWNGGAVYEPIASGTTNAQGKVSSLQRPQRFTKYQWRTAGTRSWRAWISLTPKIWGVTVTKSRVAVGDVTVVRGTSAPATAGDVVNLSSYGVWQTHTFDSGSTSPVWGTGAPFSFEVLAETSGARTGGIRVPEQSGRHSTSRHYTIKVYDADISNVVPGSTADPDEYVTVKNLGAVGLHLEGWTLSNGTDTLTLPARSVTPGNVVRIHTGSGKNTLRNLYLDLPQVWDDEGTITLEDNNGFQLGEPFTYPVVP